jgi:hypothetical protein
VAAQAEEVHAAGDELEAQDQVNAAQTTMEAVQDRMYFAPQPEDVHPDDIDPKGRKLTTKDFHIILPNYRDVIVRDKNGRPKKDRSGRVIKQRILNSLNPRVQPECQVVTFYQQRTVSATQVIKHMDNLKANYKLALDEKLVVLGHKSVYDAVLAGDADPLSKLPPGKDVVPLDVQAAIESGEYFLVVIGGGTTNLAQYNIISNLTPAE